MEIWAEKLKFWIDAELTLLHAEFYCKEQMDKTILQDARHNLNKWFGGKYYA